MLSILGMVRVMGSTRLRAGGLSLVLGLACASHDGGGEAAVAEASVEPTVPPSPAEVVCRHLVELAGRRDPPAIDSADPARVRTAVGVCTSSLVARMSGANEWQTQVQADRDRCILAASSQPELADCALPLVKKSETGASRIEEAWPNFGVIARAIERHVLTHDGDGQRYSCPGAVVGDTVVGPTPPLATACEGPPMHACRPVAESTGAGDYPSALWHDDPMWRMLGVELDRPHRLHYALKFGSRSPGGCQFTAQAFGDLDQDGVWATFEFSGAIDEFGPNENLGLWIDHEHE